MYRRRFRLWAAILVLCAALFLPAAGVNAKAKPRLNTYKVTMWKGDSTTIYVSGNKRLPVSWKTGNADVATVSNGTIRGIRGGTTFVTAKIGKKKLRCKVMVSGLSRSRITLSEKQTFSLKLCNAKGSGWTSTDSSVAKVSSSGLVTAVSEGSATISCKSGSRLLTCSIYVPSLNAYNLSLDQGDSYLLEKSGTPTMGVWSSDRRTVASVSQSGRVSAVSPGKAKITCKIGKAELVCTVKVAGTNITTAQSLLSASRASRQLVTVQGCSGEQDYMVYNQSSSCNKSNKKKLKKFMPYHGCAASAASTVLGGMVGKTITPVQMIESIEKSVFGKASWKKNYNKSCPRQLPLCLNGISKIYGKYGVKTCYVRRFTNSRARTEILSHLKTGNPIVFVVSKKNRTTGKSSRKWTNSYHTMAMLGVTDEGKVIIADSVNRSSFGNSQRLKVVNIDEILPYMFSCTKERDSNYWSGHRSCGGYLLVYSK